KRTEVREHPLRVLVDQLLDGACELRFDLVVAVGLEDSRLRFHHLRERPVADAFAVRQRPALAPVRQLPAAIDRPEQLADKTALADAGSADECHQLERTLARARSSESTSWSSSRSRPTSGVRAS